jgi:polyhydroxyalkanoate synthesis regulator phasin
VLAPLLDEWVKPGSITYKNSKEFVEAVNLILKNEINVEEQNKMGWEYIMDNLRLSKVNSLRMSIIEDLMTKRYGKTS